MGRGRRATPVRILALQGSRHAASRRDIAAPPLDPTPPDHLDEMARGHWSRLVADLGASDILRETDRAVLAMFCAAWSAWRQASAQLAAGGIVTTGPRGEPCVSPWWRVSEDSQTTMRRLLGELGLSPAARSKVAAIPRDHTAALDEFNRAIEAADPGHAASR